MANDKKIVSLEEQIKEMKEKMKLQEKEFDDTQKELKIKIDELANIEKDLEDKNEEISEYMSHIQRLQADFENFKKQTEKQKQEIIKFANENLIMNILDSYEDLERALEQSKTEKELREGVELIYSKLKSTLEKEGLEVIVAEGEKFDPFKHEALMAEASEEHENGEIIDELMKGYTLKDKVIKYSKVRVCKK
ncbi:nucleotide exchange factor GrpE [Methanobrevibacter arboriphilus]|jgi:molecular chaperone GrpE|uniref:Nucleotide exchange factor GrpE n=1 Tax=Methanobrevibacter arboriphilus TaxID=39441 RepID=A0ACA8R338_METAZ|nr:nucleotide exchange factor GrpE [Methanobrevibacter arboriphilus]MCC7562723.1 nucleotide exchange factor GrpE [Methanobrevibacter arboriphilus]BBL61990.1 nucleotide exchange factor GrpE [Methanobrevibacter arboriphilus]GLI11102.1 nucleotide exchange factor GrpE [Methanobrevibacter arboriphilus]